MPGRGWPGPAPARATAGHALAQSTTGSIIGTVRDSTGGALPGVTVTAVNQSNGATRETVTDELGAYRVTALNPGLYTLTVSLTGFRT